MTKINPGLRDSTVTTKSLILTNVLINVWVDGSGGYFSYDDEQDTAIALAEITEDIHERLVMNKEYAHLMRRRKLCTT